MPSQITENRIGWSRKLFRSGSASLSHRCHSNAWSHRHGLSGPECSLPWSVITANSSLACRRHDPERSNAAETPQWRARYASDPSESRNLGRRPTRELWTRSCKRARGPSSIRATTDMRGPSQQPRAGHCHGASPIRSGFRSGAFNSKTKVVGPHRTAPLGATRERARSVTARKLRTKSGDWSAFALAHDLLLATDALPGIHHGDLQRSCAAPGDARRMSQ